MSNIGCWTSIRTSIMIIIKGNFIGGAIVAILYTVYILVHPLPAKLQNVLILIALNLLTIVLMSLAFK